MEMSCLGSQSWKATEYSRLHLTPKLSSGLAQRQSQNFCAPDGVGGQLRGEDGRIGENGRRNGALS